MSTERDETWHVEAAPKELGQPDLWLVSQGAFSIPVYTLIGAQAVAKRLNASEAERTRLETALRDVQDYLADWLPWPDAETELPGGVRQFLEGLTSALSSSTTKGEGACDHEWGEPKPILYPRGDKAFTQQCMRCGLSLRVFHDKRFTTKGGSQ